MAPAEPGASGAKADNSPPAFVAKPAPDFAAERKALIGKIPSPPADAIAFDASQMKPLIQDDKGFAILPNTPISGMTVAKLGQKYNPESISGGYWKVTGVKPGSYYVGIWYESSSDGIEARLSYTGPMWAYLNGRILQLSTHSEPIQVCAGALLCRSPVEGG